MKLDHYTKGDYTVGAPLWRYLLWYFIGAPLVRSSCLPSSDLKITILKLFGAKIGSGVRLKPGLKVKFPWRLEIGDHSWIGEDTWIDNLAPVVIGSHCCVSQGVYICTGNHDWKSEQFTLNVQDVKLANHVWLAAKSVVGPGVYIAEGAVLSLGSIAVSELKPWSIYSGNPAQRIKDR